MAVLLPESGTAVLPLHDIQGDRRSTRDSVQYRWPPWCTQTSRYSSSIGIAHTAAQFRGLQSLGPPTAQRDGSSTGQRCYSWSSILPEAASALDAARRPSSTYQLVSSAALCAEEGTHPGGTVQDLRGILVQPR